MRIFPSPAPIFGGVGLSLLLWGCTIDQGIGDDRPGVTDTGPSYDPTTADTDRDGSVDASDCAPTDQDIHPGALELCDTIDNNCNGEVDEGFDVDDDGFMDVRACYALPGEWDCDDADDTVNPDQDEICDGKDNDCDGHADDTDDDADGVTACEDCDDDDAFIFPGAAEACDGADNNCDGQIDEIWDADEDGISPCQGDCDDEDEDVRPGAADVCDGVDNDCSGAADEPFDLDLDGVTTCAGDCDDTDPAVRPGAPEICDGKDDDCDAQTGETEDDDGDGYTVCTGDCDDGDATAFPANPEACDGVDNDCSGHVDDDPTCWDCTSVGAYELCTSAASWTTAEGVCEGLGGTLAVVNSSSENSDLVDLSPTPTWVGATDAAIEGTWMEPDGVSPIPYDRWEAGEPDDEGNDCAVLNPGGHREYWADAPCSATYRFVCEF